MFQYFTAGIIAAVTLLLILLAIYRNKMVFDPSKGVYFDNKTKLHCCPSCHAKGLKAPLRETDEAWRCMVKDCGSVFVKHGKSVAKPPVTVAVATYARPNSNFL